MKPIAFGLSLLLVSGCASHVVVPNDNGRSALCSERARRAVPSMTQIVHEAAAKTEHPAWSKTLAYSVGIAPVSAAVWLKQREAYEAAFDRCLIETMPGPQVEK